MSEYEGTVNPFDYGSVVESRASTKSPRPDGMKVITYRCPACKRIIKRCVYRRGLHLFRRSFCERKGKYVRMIRVRDRRERVMNGKNFESQEEYFHPDRFKLSPRPKGAKRPMYQICLVIKENMDQEIGSMMVRGFDRLDEAAEQMLVDFARLNDANELSAKVNEAIGGILDMPPEDLEVLLVRLAELEEVMAELVK